MPQAEPDSICGRCSQPIRSNERVKVLDGQPAHLRCVTQEQQLRSEGVQPMPREPVKGSGDPPALSRRLMETLTRPVPCPICGTALSRAEAVMFRGPRLVHARCWPGDEAPVRLCAKCRQPLDRFEPAVYDGRIAHHVQCWAGRQPNERVTG
jgi:hypothetical protein